jgi:hypothetical protein
MLRKTLEFATPGTRLSVAHNQLVVERPNEPKVTRPISTVLCGRYGALGAASLEHRQTVSDGPSENCKVALRLSLQDRKIMIFSSCS